MRRLYSTLKRRSSWLWAGAIAVTALAPLAARSRPARQEPAACRATAASPPPGRPASDLYCLELFPSPGLPPAFGSVSGTVELGRVRSPFGVAVSADGELLYDVTFALRALPDPATLGPYTAYIAWATTPILRPMIPLGEVRNGRTVAGRVAFNKFILLVTAEPSASVQEREGRLVLRGLSPSMMLQPHDLQAMLAATVARGPGPGTAPERLPAAGAGAAAEHAGHGAAAGADSTDAWIAPPMHPAITMPPALMTLRPDVSPFVPGLGATLPIPDAVPRRLARLTDGDTLDLEAGLVRRTIRGRTFTMYGFNGQYPGPLIHVDQGATIVVNFRNSIELPTAVHWHGVRLDNRFDGVPHVTQEPVPPGGTFRYQVHFRDAGIYWYHPHHREDIQQDLGLYGNMLVAPREPGYFNPVDREEVLMLDDLLVAEEGLVPHGLEHATHALMGRFGNVLLVNGEPDYRLEARRGEVVRFFLTNVANTRTFNLRFEGAGARLKLIGSDIGKFEREEWVDNIVIAPAERYIVEVRFDQPGTAALVNRVQGLDHVYGNFFAEVDTLGRVRVAEEPASTDYGRRFDTLRENTEIKADIDRYRQYFFRPVDYQLVLTLRVDHLPYPVGPLMRFEGSYFNPVEWSGTMPEMNWVSTSDGLEWILRDLATGQENLDIAWRFRVGDVVKIRLANDRYAVHAMQHPIHLHGQRFLVLAQNGVPNDNLVWKDTILLPVGATAELLLELSNPGRWMLHCHIAEHLESGMAMVFEVEE